ncbi:Ionotropic receptor 109 [Blattella germanica]|nr:Ionotropic receptor 109 [Blattella germanica]
MRWIPIVMILRKCQSNILLKKDLPNKFEFLVKIAVQGSFDNFWCLQLTTDSNVTEKMLPLIYEECNSPITFTDSTCKGQIIISNKEASIPHIVGRRSTSNEFRFLILLIGNLNMILQDVSMFGEAEVLLVDTDNLYSLVTSRTARHFLRMTSSKSELFPAKVTTLPDLMGRSLKVGTFKCPPFSYFEGRADSKDVENLHGVSDKFDGIEMLAFLELAKRLNFSWNMYEPSDTNKWGTLYKNKTWSGGIFGRLANNSIDIAFCALWVVEEQREISDFTVPWSQLCNTFIVPRPHLKYYWYSIFLSLKPTVWVTFGIFVAATALLLHLFVKLHLRIIYSPKSHKYEEFGTSLLEALGMLMSTYSPTNEQQLGPARYVICTWCFITLMFLTAYSCGLVSHLTVPTFSDNLETVRDLVEADFTWGHTYFPSVYSIFDDRNTWHQKFINRFRLQSDPERNVLLETGKHAVFGYKVEGTVRYFLETERMEPEAWRQMCMIKECMSRYHIALGLTKNSPYTAAFNQGLIRLQKAGIMEYWQRNVILRRGNSNVSTIFYENSNIASDRPEKLTLLHLEGAFFVLFAGLTVAGMSFIAEIIARGPKSLLIRM